MTDYSNAIWLPNSNAFAGQNQPRYIVLHGTAGGTSAQAIATFFQSTQGTANPVSATYVCDQAGVTVQCNSEADGAWANGYISGSAGISGDGVGNGYHDSWWDAVGNPNNVTISIEHVKSTTDNSAQLTDVQKLASFHLIADICQRHNIPMRKADATGGITGHYSIDPVNRAHCPGVYPWEELFSFLQEGQTMALEISQVAQFFLEITKDQRWHCKSTGFDIAYGILTYYRTCTATGLNGLSQYGLPTSGELSHPTIKDATYQVFERGIIAYDPRHALDSVPGISGPCYPMHIGVFPPEQPAVPINITSAISDLQTVQAAIGNILTTLKG